MHTAFAALPGLLLCVSRATGFAPAPVRPTPAAALHASTADAAVANPRQEGLALELDDGTRKAHSMAENTAFVTGFFKGLSTKDEYAKLLTSLYFVYVAMEAAFDATSEDAVRAMDDARLRRVAAAREDLAYYYGAGWEDKIAPSRATRKYVDRIATVARDAPKLLIAHQYSRYLGDLFGGQMMGGMATKSLRLPPGGEGVGFYRFEDIDDTAAFIADWYRTLNALDLTAAERREIVDEANRVFALNIAVFDELEGSALTAVASFAWQSFREKVGLA